MTSRPVSIALSTEWDWERDHWNGGQHQVARQSVTFTYADGSSASAWRDQLDDYHWGDMPADERKRMMSNAENV